MMVATTTVSAAFRLECSLEAYKLCSTAMEHLLDHMIGPNAKNPVTNFSRQVPVSQMPGKAQASVGIHVPDFDDRLRSRPHHEQSPISKLQGVAVSHGNRFRKIEKYVLALIRNEVDAAAMARVEIESERACRLFGRPMSRLAVN